MSNDQEIKFAFFGGEPLAVPTLNALKDANLWPELIVCNPDRPSGRGHTLTSPSAKVWAQEHAIPVLQPPSLKDRDQLTPLTDQAWDVFVVVAYNHILPSWLIELPTHGTVNVHPSLLPKLRGPSPIRTAILENQPDAVGVSIMLLDEQMDHGPILAQEAYSIPESEWPPRGDKLDRRLATLGGKLLARTLPQYVAGAISPQEQDHDAATYTQKLAKADGEIEYDPHDPPRGFAARRLLCQIRALAGWPETYFFYQGKRIKIKEAELATNGSLRLRRIIPEGKSEMDASSYFPSS